MVILGAVIGFVVGVFGGYFLRGYMEGDVIGSLRDGLAEAETYIDSLEDKIVELTPKPKKPKA